MLEEYGFYSGPDGNASSCKDTFKQMGDLVFSEYYRQASKDIFWEKCCKAAAAPATTTEAAPTERPDPSVCAEYRADAMLEAGGFYSGPSGEASSCKDIFKQMGDLVFSD